MLAGVFGHYQFVGFWRKKLDVFFQSLEFSQNTWVLMVCVGFFEKCRDWCWNTVHLILIHPSIKTEHASSCISLLSLNFSPSLHTSSSRESPCLKNFVPAEFVNEKFSEVALLIFSMCGYLPKGTNKALRFVSYEPTLKIRSPNLPPSLFCPPPLNASMIYGTFHFGIP